MKSFISVVVFAAIAVAGVTSANTDNKQGSMVSTSYGGGYGGASSSSYAAPAPAPAAPSYGGSSSSYSAPAPAHAAPSYGGSSSSYSAPAPAPAAPSYGGASSSYSAPATHLYSAPAAVAYAPRPISIPAPPCAKNYLFSCQPSLSPVGCSSPSSSGGYGSSAAYSQYVPSYVLPPHGYGY